MSMPAAASLSTKSPHGYKRTSTLDPQQMQLFQQLFQNLLGGGALESGQSYLQQLLSGDPEATKAFEAPYMRQFNEQIIPGIAERFAGMGAGAQNSSAFQQALGQAGSGLQENLASLREGMRFQASNRPFEQLMQVLGLNTSALTQRQQPFWKSALSGLSGGLGEGLGSALGGGLTGGLGSLGSMLGGLFNKQQGSLIGPRGQITGKF